MLPASEALEGVNALISEAFAGVSSTCSLKIGALEGVSTSETVCSSSYSSSSSLLAFDAGDGSCEACDAAGDVVDMIENSEVSTIEGEAWGEGSRDSFGVDAVANWKDASSAKDTFFGEGVLLVRKHDLVGLSLLGDRSHADFGVEPLTDMKLASSSWSFLGEGVFLGEALSRARDMTENPPDRLTRFLGDVVFALFGVVGVLFEGSLSPRDMAANFGAFFLEVDFDLGEGAPRFVGVVNPRFKESRLAVMAPLGLCVTSKSAKPARATLGFSLEANLEREGEFDGASC